jgi:lipoprotein-anchoring transpeptidase ErfK/SrfK
MMQKTNGRRWQAAMAVGMALTVCLAFLPATGGPGSVSAQETGSNIANADQFAGIEIPPDMGQAPFQVYVPQTKHTIRGQMLDYWRANGAASVYGNPISEPFAAENGYYSQAFEGGIFQYLPDYLYSEDPDVRLMPIGDTILASRTGDFRRDGRRAGGGGDTRNYAWRPVDPNGKSAAKALQSGGIYAGNTAHTITGEFLKWYDTHEGHFYLGDPLSQPVIERGVTVQYFEGGMLKRTANGQVGVGNIVTQHAGLLGIETAPVKRDGLLDYDESLFIVNPNPNPRGDLRSPGKRRIEVSIGQQTLWAYQGDTLVAQTLVSTGIEPNHTERGNFHVRYKLEKETMSGFTSSTGEVVGMGDGSGQQSGIPYEVKDVPNVMYINHDAEALHGAYWHNNFGTPMSHGCINLPLDFAAFLFGWAPLGTEVWVHD